MEKGLHERDIVGLQDFVLLENCDSEEAFIDNLRKRFQENLIYVSSLVSIELDFFIYFFFCFFLIEKSLILDIHWSSFDFRQSI